MQSSSPPSHCCQTIARAFFEDVATALAGRELGDGLVGRICREVQARYLRPPDLSHYEEAQPLRKIR
jgi:hypothetical protein